MNVKSNKHKMNTMTNSSANAENVTFNLNSTTVNKGHRFSNAESTAIFICLGFLALLIAMTNAFVIYLVKRNSYLQTSTNFSLASLACSDFLAGFLLIPLIITSAITGKRGLYFVNHLSSRFICLSTILHLSSIALERYILIVHRMNTELMSKRSTLMILPGIWLFSLAVTLVPMSWIDFQDPNLQPKVHMNRVDVIYDVCIILILVFLPLLIIIYAYVRIYIIVRRQHRSVSLQEAQVDENASKRKKRLKKEIRAIFIYAGMVVTFILGWFYYFINGLMTSLQEGEWLSKVPPWSDIMLMFTRFATSFVNPVLYTFFKMDFIKAVRAFRRGIECSPKSWKQRAQGASDSFGMKVMKDGKLLELNGNPLGSRMETSYTTIPQRRNSTRSLELLESLYKNT